jgi:hypothetical protein
MRRMRPGQVGVALIWAAVLTLLVTARFLPRDRLPAVIAVSLWFTVCGAALLIIEARSGRRR